MRFGTKEVAVQHAAGKLGGDDWLPPNTPLILEIMRPGDHPEFFRFPPPDGTSRESTIRLSADGDWFHDGDKVEHEALSRALSSWISRHPDDGRYILTNGYDWTYVTIDDAPFTVRSISVTDSDVTLLLSDATSEPWVPETTRVGANDALYALVKRDAVGGPYEARFSRHAQTSLSPLLVSSGNDGRGGEGMRLRLGGRTVPFAPLARR